MPRSRWTCRAATTCYDPRAALLKVLAGEALPDTRFDVTTALCKVRDLFSRH